jgi:septal ring-binding cell division protein DamX
MARKFAAQATGNYTVQFELVCETSSLTTAVSLGGANVWFVPFAYHNRACYRVFWGRYATQDEATAAIRDVPAAIRGPKPVVVSVPKP